MFRYIFVGFALLARFLAAAMTEDEMKEMHAFMVDDSTKACMKEFDLTKEDFEDAKKNKDMTGIDPCFVACFMKGKGLIDDKGMYDDKVGMDIAKKFIKSPEDLAKIGKVSEMCKKVNDEKVSDEDKGCDRAILLIQCLIENKSIIL